MKMKIVHHPFADWFFPQISLRIIKLYRISLASVTLLTALAWVPHAHAFFSNQGYASAQYVLETSRYSHLSLFFLNDAPWFIYLCLGIWILACLSQIFGRGSRWTAIVMWLMLISFASRFPLVFYGGIDVIHMLLFFNMFHPTDGYTPWSEGGVAERNRTVPAWSMRMIMISICLVYFFAGAQKIRVNTWFNGSEIINSLSSRFGTIDYSWLVGYPLVINGMTYLTWFSEISFGFLVWNPATHRLALLLLAFMHIGVGFMMNASLFSEIMLVALVCFLTPQDEQRIGELWDMYAKRLRAGWQRSRLRRKLA